jgi:very-short-patch-repair endonuclease
MSRNHAKSLRSNMTDAERRLWYYLRAHRFAGMKFRRQALVGPYVVDFASLRQNLIIEVDGGQHADSESDQRRAQWLEEQGFRILRFWNNEVLNNIGGVLEAIMIAATNPSPGALLRNAPPSPTRGEGNSHCEH